MERRKRLYHTRFCAGVAWYNACLMRERWLAIQQTLTRTRQAAFGRVATLFGATEITPNLWDDLEAALIQADVGVSTTSDLLGRMRERAKR